jgi:hypothetical protein
MDKTFVIVGANTWRANVRTFFWALDQAFGVQSIAYRDLSSHIKGGFLFALARVFADHQTFWEDKRLTMAKYDIEKLRSFPIRDPAITAMIASSGSKLNPLLYAQLIRHMNSGRRTRKIVKWNGLPASEIPDAVLEDSGDGNEADVELSCKAG